MARPKVLSLFLCFFTVLLVFVLEAVQGQSENAQTILACKECCRKFDEIYVADNYDKNGEFKLGHCQGGCAKVGNEDEDCHYNGQYRWVRRKSCLLGHRWKANPKGRYQVDGDNNGENFFDLYCYPSQDSGDTIISETAAPTVSPTTPQPSTSPSTSPSLSPSTTPTTTPTKSPTTPEPTTSPTTNPTRAPSTPQPSRSPTTPVLYAKNMERPVETGQKVMISVLVVGLVAMILLAAVVTVRRRKKRKGKSPNNSGHDIAPAVSHEPVMRQGLKKKVFDVFSKSEGPNTGNTRELGREKNMPGFGFLARRGQSEARAENNTGNAHSFFDFSGVTNRLSSAAKRISMRFQGSRNHSNNADPYPVTTHMDYSNASSPRRADIGSPFNTTMNVPPPPMFGNMNQGTVPRRTRMPPRNDSSDSYSSYNSYTSQGFAPPPAFGNRNHNIYQDSGSGQGNFFNRNEFDTLNGPPPPRAQRPRPAPVQPPPGLPPGLMRPPRRNLHDSFDDDIDF